jgi:hypothetical protein
VARALHVPRVSRVPRVHRPRWLPVVWLGALFGPALAMLGSGVPRASAGLPGDERADSVAFEAPAGCPSADAFVAKVGERGGRAARVVKEPDARKARYRVRVARAGRGFRGTLTIVDGVGSNERAVDGGTCVEVVDALAFVTAMALEAPAEPDAMASGAASASGGAAASASSSTAELAASASASTRDDPGTAGLPPPTKRPLPSEARPVVWAAGADFALSGLDGAPPLGGGLYVEAARDGARALAPALRVGILGLWASRDVPNGGTLGLRWTTLAADVCAVRMVATKLRLDACATVQLGALHANPSSEVVAATASLRPWLALGGTTRAQLALGSGFYVEAHAGLLAPLTRDRFSLGDGTEVYRAAAITLLGGFGVGFHFS